MQFASFLLAVLPFLPFLTLASAQASIPSCASNCIESSLSATTCGSGDLACLCLDVAYTTAILQCATSGGCTQSDLIGLGGYQAERCGAAVASATSDLSSLASRASSALTGAESILSSASNQLSSALASATATGSGSARPTNSASASNTAGAAGATSAPASGAGKNAIGGAAAAGIAVMVIAML